MNIFQQNIVALNDKKWYNAKDIQKIRKNYISQI